MLSGWLHAAPADATEQTLERLWIHSVGGYAVRDKVRGIVAHWSDPLQTDADLRHASVHAELRLLVPVRAAILEEDLQPLAERIAQLGVAERKPKPLLQGRHLQPLGIPPGPRMGEILRAVYTAQLDGTVTSLPEAERAAAALWAGEARD